MKSQESNLEKQVAAALRSGTPVRDLAGVSIRDVRTEPEQPFDISFQLQSGNNQVLVLGEVKPAFTPRILEEIAPWIRRLRSLRQDVSVAVITPVLSGQAQAYCLANGIDFLDLAGNLSINLPNKFTLQRIGMRPTREFWSPKEGPQAINVFSGRSSRVLRVLLERPKAWTITEIVRELAAETKRFRSRFPKSDIVFEISVGAISKAVASLEEQLLVRRRGTVAVVTEPERLLQQWAEKYRERYRWRLRRSFQTSNPFGNDLMAVDDGVRQRFTGPYAFTGALAVSRIAPFVDIDLIDVFIAGSSADSMIRKLNEEPAAGPPLRFIYPYDNGVFMYAGGEGTASMVSPIQAYLDLYARGGRDMKQADYLLVNAIQRRWAAA